MMPVIDWLCGRRRPRCISKRSVFLPLQFAKLNSHRVLVKSRPMNTCRVLSLFFLAVACSVLHAQTVNTFEGIDASQLTNPGFDIDPNGAVGTKQFMEWVNVAYQAYDKVTFAPVWSAPQAGATPWKNAGLTNCTQIAGDGLVNFDRLASRWIISARTNNANNYFFCVAISNTDDLSSSSLKWFTYAFPLNSILGTNGQGNVYFPDWPKLGSWSDAYYMSTDLEDPGSNFKEVGVVACALDRANMLVGGVARSPQCFRDPASGGTSVYLGHSLIPADLEGTTAPPVGRDEYFVAIQNPVLDGVTTTSNSFNIWDFHVDWLHPANSTFTESTQPVVPYTPGCYTAAQPVNTVCVPESTTSITGIRIDSVGDRFMPRLAYRNFSTYESFLFSHTILTGSGNSKQTGVRWYELRGAGTPALFQDGTVSPDSSLFRFMPSIAQDGSAEAAVGYSVSNGSTHPGISASWWNLANLSAPVEFSLFPGAADEENKSTWGDYTSMTVDPVDDCTFWYVNEYFSQNQTGTQHNWQTRISNFRLPGCGQTTLSPATGLAFGSVATGTTSASQAAILTNGQNATLNISSIGFSGANGSDFAQTNNCGSSLSAGANCSIDVTFTPGALGSRSATLTVTDDASNSPQTIGVSGTGITPVTVSPTSLNFGNVTLGSSSTAPAVTLTNNQNVALTNISIVANAPFSQVNTCGTSIAPGAKCKITVTFTPAVLGTKTGAVTISDSAATSPQTIAVRGTGASPVTFSPTSLSFGTVAVGNSSSPLPTTLTNHQKTPLTISSISIIGTNSADFSQTNNCPGSLAAGGTCTISVTFSPRASGSRSGKLKIVDNAVNSPQNVALSGTGQ